MIAEYLSPIANHIWQSTLFAGAAGLLALALRKNSAAVRYWVWLAASLKFFVPFSLLVSIGRYFGLPAGSAITNPQWVSMMEDFGRPFSFPPPPPGLMSQSSAPSANIPEVLFGR